MPFSEHNLNRMAEQLSGNPLSRRVAFNGGEANDPGDFDGTGNPMTLFTVTGVVAVTLFAVCQNTVTGASATVRVGTSISNASLIASTTASNIVADEIWHDASPDASIELTSILTEKVVTQDIIQTVGTANLTGGELTYFLSWRPISTDGMVEVA